MTRIPTDPNDMDFDDHLRSAKAEVPLPGGFQSEVWRRIAAEESTTFSGKLSRWMESVWNLLARPVAAGAVVVALVAGGAWLGTLNRAGVEDGKSAYVQSISPFAHANEDSPQ